MSSQGNQDNTSELENFSVNACVTQYKHTSVEAVDRHHYRCKLYSIDDDSRLDVPPNPLMKIHKVLVLNKAVSIISSDSIPQTVSSEPIVRMRNRESIAKFRRSVFHTGIGIRVIET